MREQHSQPESPQLGHRSAAANMPAARFFTHVWRRYRRMIEHARAFQCSLLGDGSGTLGAAAGEGDQSVVVQFELAAGCYATCFLFEMCAGDGT